MPPTKRALLIGIDFYAGTTSSTGNWAGLFGSVQDINQVEEYLPGIGLDAADITKLITGDAFGGPQPEQFDCPTYEKITAALNAEIAAATEDSHVYIHYCGHGVQIASSNLRRKFQEGIVPADINTAGRYLGDTEIARFLAQMAAKGSLVTVILDSCRSGDATRNQALPVARSMNADGCWSVNKLGYELLTACMSSQSAYGGCLTPALGRLLTGAGSPPNVTYRMLYRRLSDELTRGEMPTLVFLGDYDNRLFLGSTKTDHPYTLPVRFDIVACKTQSTVTLDAGSMNSVYPMSEYIIYKQDDRAFETPIAQIKVREVFELTSRAEIIASTAGLPATWKGRAVLLKTQDTIRTRLEKIEIEEGQGHITGIRLHLGAGEGYVTQGAVYEVCKPPFARAKITVNKVSSVTSTALVDGTRIPRLHGGGEQVQLRPVPDLPTIKLGVSTPQAIRERLDLTVELGAGKAHGVRVGWEYEVHLWNAQDFKHPIAEIIVVETMELTSRARITKHLTQNIAPNWWYGCHAVLTNMPTEMKKVLKVERGELEATRGLIVKMDDARRQRGVACLGLHAVSKNDRTPIADFILAVGVGESKYTLKNSLDNLIHGSCRSRQQFLDATANLAKYQTLRSLRTTNGEFFRVEREQNSKIFKTNETTPVTITFENPADVPVYLTVFHFGPLMNITQLYPEHSDFELVDPGGIRLIKLTLAIPEALRINGPVNNIIKCFTTTRPTSFRTLETPKTLLSNPFVKPIGVSGQGNPLGRGWDTWEYNIQVSRE